MKKNILFMMTLLLSTLWAQAARDWNPPSGNQYPSHAVVYATLFDASGQETDNVADMRVLTSSLRTPRNINLTIFLGKNAKNRAFLV